jgi:ribosomal protein L15E
MDNISGMSSKKTQRDNLGSRIGTVASKVNKAVGRTWKNENDIAREAGLTLREARMRLYYAAEQGILQRERLIRYRIPPKKAA